MTRYLERALAGVPASADDWNDHLIAFHRAFPNVTPELLSSFKTADGETSYQRLARHVHEQAPDAHHVADIGCGSGELLALLDSAFGSDVELTGIDLVSSELELARRRVPRAALVCGDAAQALPMQSLDVAVAHLSFLSMARLRDALRRIHDALRPGGLLTFVIEDPSVPGSFIAMMAPLMHAVHERHPSVNLAVPERDGLENDVTLRALLKAVGFTSAIDVELVVLSTHLTLDEIVEFALRSYPFALLDERELMELRDLLRASLGSKDGRTLVKLPLKLVTARREDAIPNMSTSTVTEFLE